MDFLNTNPNFRHKDSLTVWPYRSGEERSITQLRLTDIKPLREELLRFPVWTQVPLMNFIIYNRVQQLDHQCIDLLAELEEQDAIDSCKEFSDWLKSSFGNVTMPYATEMQCLFGYMVYGEFNYEEEAIKLANAGLDASWNDDVGWEHILKAAVETIASLDDEPPPDGISLKDFIRRGEWIREGSASLGYEEVEVEEEKIKIKLKKNLVPFFYTVEELEEMCLNVKEERDNSFIKPELAKKRLAVAGDIANYINWSYIMYYFGHPYKKSAFNTLDETPEEELARQSSTLEFLAGGGYASSVDLKAMDHQPNEALANEFCDSTLTVAEQRATHSDVFKVSAILRTSYRNAYLLVTPPDKRAQGRQYLPIRGSVRSGIRPTSWFGNAFTYSQSLANAILHGIHAYNRGDDIMALGNKEAVVRATQQFDAWGFEISVVKFGIGKSAAEFLRNLYSDRKVLGYLCRALAGLTQRKPWSNEPPSTNAIVTRQLKVIATCRRRGGAMDGMVTVVTQTWSRVTKQSILWLQAPSPIGLGVLPFRNLLPQARRVTKQPKLQATVPEAPFAAELVDYRFIPYGITLQPEERKTLLEEQFRSSLLADAIPQVHGIQNAIEKASRYPNVDWAKIKEQRIEHPGVPYVLVEERPHFVYTGQELAREALAITLPRCKEQLITPTMKMKKAFVKWKKPQAESSLIDAILSGVPPQLELYYHPLVATLLASTVVSYVVSHQHIRALTSYTIWLRHFASVSQFMVVPHQLLY